MEQPPAAQTLAYRARYHASVGNFALADVYLEDYRAAFGCTRGYYNLMRMIDFARHAAESYRADYDLVRAR